MKGLVIGDQHFKIDNIDQVDIFISKLKELLAKNKYDFIISGGDLLDTHERLHTLALNKADEYLKLLSSHSKTFVLVGNHDMINPSQFLSENHWLNVYKGWTDKLVIVDKVISQQINGIDIIFAPYVPDGRLKEALSTLEWKESGLIFAHQTLNGVKMGAIKTENIEEWENSFPNLVAFHVHDMQIVKKNLFYTGSCMQHSYGESISKFIYEITDNVNEKSLIDDEDDGYISMNNNIMLKKISLGMPKKKIIHCTTEELEKMESVNDIIPKRFTNSNYQIKLVVSGSIASFKTVKKRNDVKALLGKYKVLFKNVTTITQQEDLHTISSKDFMSEFNDILLDYLNKKDLVEFYNQLVC